MSTLNKLKYAVLLAICANNAYADDASDARIAKLQKMLEDQQVQMQAIAEELKVLQKKAPAVAAATGGKDEEQEQKWQIDAMSEELKALEQRPTVFVSEKDGIGLKSSNGDFSIKFHGLVQADYRNVDADTINLATANTNITSGWMVRKARPWIEGSLFGWIDYRLTPEFATTTPNVATVSTGTTTVNGSTTLGSPEVIDAFFDAKFKPWLKLRVGKFKPFVGLARLQSDVDGKFVEQSFVTANLLPQRDVGASVFGDVFDSKLSYAIGYSNGVIDGGDQSVALDGNDDKEFTARVFAQPFKGNGTPLAGLGFGIANTSINQRGANTNSGTSQLPSFRSFSQLNFFSYTTTPGQAAFADGRRTRWAPQMYYYYGPFGLMSEYASESQAVTRSTNHQTLDNKAWQATFSYLLTGEDASYSGVKPQQAFNPNGGGWGAWELVGRVSKMTVDDKAFIGTATTRLSNIATSAKTAKAWGLGVNWYLNNYTRFALDYENTSFDGGAAGSLASTTAITKLVDKKTEKAMIGRLQVSF
ncbi:MAG TPA: porin [Methylotenera sp.]|nr:porin [Methylotenera sp.]HPH04877.1 porin [Methylotenera sp.]HPN01441.1 porin [Methylotenera sp.]